MNFVIQKTERLKSCSLIYQTYLDQCSRLIWNLMPSRNIACWFKMNLLVTLINHLQNKSPLRLHASPDRSETQNQRVSITSFGCNNIFQIRWENAWQNTTDPEIKNDFSGKSFAKYVILVMQFILLNPNRFWFIAHLLNVN